VSKDSSRRRKQLFDNRSKQPATRTYLSGLSRPRLSLDDDKLVLPHGFDQLILELVDGKFLPRFQYGVVAIRKGNPRPRIQSLFSMDAFRRRGKARRRIRAAQIDAAFARASVGHIRLLVVADGTSWSFSLAARRSAHPSRSLELLRRTNSGHKKQGWQSIGMIGGGEKQWIFLIPSLLRVNCRLIRNRQKSIVWLT